MNFHKGKIIHRIYPSVSCVKIAKQFYTQQGHREVTTYEATTNRHMDTTSSSVVTDTNKSGQLFLNLNKWKSKRKKKKLTKNNYRAHVEHA